MGVVDAVGGATATVRRYWIPIVALLLLTPLAFTAPHVLLDAENPEGVVEPPVLLQSSSAGFLLIILDGVGQNVMLDDQLMPQLNSRRDDSALIHIRTGPLTLSATCISEMMTGVPNSPIDGLRNFDLPHPGGEDPWTLASQDDRFSVGIVGSYVTGNIYGSMDSIDFVDTFQGHSDYYEGDISTSEVLGRWLDDKEHNVITAHFSGPDKVGHKWGAASQEYSEKILDIDSMLPPILAKVPDDWTVVITADHGMTDSGSHGSAEEKTRDVVAFVTGPHILPGKEANAQQRDIPALMSTVLDIAFPIQLHGRIPLDILDIPNYQMKAIEQWNWEAAYHRQVFINSQNGAGSEDLSLDEIEWDKISNEGVFSRNSDIVLSIVIWFFIVLLSIIAVGPNLKENPREIKFLLGYSLIIIAFTASHASLSYSAMIPRGFGAICATWLVGWPLRNQRKPPFFANLDLSNPWLGLVVCSTLWLIFGTLTQAVLVTCMIWVLIFSISTATGHPLLHSKLPTYAPWLLAVAAFTFGSIRLWFALIPFLFIIGSIAYEQYRERLSLEKRLPMLAMSFLLLASVTMVHRRITGSHLILKLVNLSESNPLSFIMMLAILGLSAYISVTCIEGKFNQKKTIIFTSWLYSGVLVNLLSNTILDRIFLGLIVLLYLASLFPRYIDSKYNFTHSFAFAALSMHVLVTWGAWTSAVTIVLISCIGPLFDSFKNIFEKFTVSFDKPRYFIAMAVFPWVIWALWWTLLGQVNGLQTCFEGICPHPRELDPGAVIVNGGYFAGGDNPSTSWMTFMVASPLVVASSLIMFELRNFGLKLYPYIISQTLLILGCAATFAFSPEYPRLVFSLTWNIGFAWMQILFAVLAIGAFSIRKQFYSGSN